MKKYKSVEVSEKLLEDLIRQGADLIEEGLRYIDHQRMTDRGRRLDILMVDSGNALVVAELKVVEDDAMLSQGIDYYDYVARNIGGIARVYRDFRIDPNQPIRLLLIAPSFSISLLNRCKWIDIPISLFEYKCVTFEDSKEIIPVFSEKTFPSIPEVVKTYSLDDHLSYITNIDMKKMATDLIEEIRNWDTEKIVSEPTKDYISLKISGKVFSHIGCRRKYFVVSTANNEGNWRDFQIHQKEDLEAVKVLLKDSVKKFGQGH